MTFSEWLARRNIDCQQLSPELEISLREQFDREHQRLTPVVEVLIVPTDCSWPARSYWVPAASQ